MYHSDCIMLIAYLVERPQITSFFNYSESYCCPGGKQVRMKTKILSPLCLYSNQLPSIQNWFLKQFRFSHCGCSLCLAKCSKIRIPYCFCSRDTLNRNSWLTSMHITVLSDAYFCHLDLHKLDY